MISVLEYMQFSTHVYAASRNNRIGVPDGWEQLEWLPDDPETGFSAGAYKNERTNEIIIAYTGTNSILVDGGTSYPGAVGLPAAQYFMRTTRRALRNPGCAPLVNIEAPVFRRLRM